MNNKGFAISSIMYGILIIFLILVFSTLSILVTRGNSLSKIKNNALNTIIGGSDDTAVMSNIVADFSSMNITSDAADHVTINYNINVYSPYGYVIESSVSGNTITYTASSSGEVIDTVTKTLVTDASPLVHDYEYKKGYEKVLLNPGLYKLDVWGAKTTANGNHASGYLYLEEKKIVYIYVGGKGRTGYNAGHSHISYNEGLLSTLGENIIISDGYIGGVTEGNIENEVRTGNGKVTITSLIYFTK
nr:hypothetical protein [Bacilli bacterium]